MPTDLHEPTVGIDMSRGAVSADQGTGRGGQGGCVDCDVDGLLLTAWADPSEVNIGSTIALGSMAACVIAMARRYEPRTGPPYMQMVLLGALLILA